MDLHETLSSVLARYGSAKKETFAAHPVATILRREARDCVASLLQDDRYVVTGSAGQGTWANVPWIGVFDRFITTTAQEGFYIVYLFRSDLSGVYLSLNQGVTRVREAYGTDARSSLRIRARDYLARIGKTPDRFSADEIHLQVPPSDLGAFYEAGNICSVFYQAGAVPAEEILEADLRKLVELYQSLVDNEVAFSEAPDPIIPPVVEDLTRYRWHRRLDRDQRAVQEVKRAKGAVCEACKFDFEHFYGEVGRGFIELHHLVPVSQLQGLQVSRDPIRDYAVLCSNCHSMIHRLPETHDLDRLRSVIESQRQGAQVRQSCRPISENRRRVRVSLLNWRADKADERFIWQSVAEIAGEAQSFAS